MKTLDVLVAGDLYEDLIMSGFDFWPQLGRESFAKNFQREIGGGTAITASGLAKLGSKTGIYGLVGAEDGRGLLGRLQHSRVDTNPVEFDEQEPTGFTVVATTSEDRAFLSYLGANRRLIPRLLELADDRRLEHVRHVHLACAPPPDVLGRLIDGIHSNQCTCSIDVGWHEDWLSNQTVLAVLKKVDLFFPNEVEARQMTGEEDPVQAIRCMQNAGLRRVAVKMGPRGAALLWDGEILRVGALPVEAIDTTGAGDCFDAGFLYAWLHNMPPDRCLRAGNICGGFSTRAFGGIAGFPDLEELICELDKEERCAN